MQTSLPSPAAKRFDIDPRLDAVLRVRVRHEHDRPRWVSLGEAGEHVLGGLDPRLGDPSDVRHDARPLVRLTVLVVEAPLGELALDLADRA